jgi:hypothetical protein
VENVSKAADAVSGFVQDHAAAIAGFAAGAIVGIGCGIAIGWTGVGAVACGALAGAVGSVVSDMVEGGHSWKEMTANAIVGGVVGGVTGGLFSIGSQALSAGVRTTVSSGVRAGGTAARQAARDEVENIASGRLGGLAGKVGCSNSFAGSTAVLMADGSHKQISDVRVGDRVVATDPTTGQTAVREVTDRIVGSGQKNLVDITVDTDGAAGSQTADLTATDGHPFWVESESRWVQARDLKTGYRLETADHRPATVTGIRTWTHTFYVLAGGSPVLVHNASAACATFVADANGTVIPTSASRLESGLQAAVDAGEQGFSAFPTKSAGSGFQLPGGSRIRIMQPSANGNAGLRASFTNGADAPISPFTGKPVQPPKGVNPKQYVRSRTHVELEP